MPLIRLDSPHVHGRSNPTVTANSQRFNLSLNGSLNALVVGVMSLGMLVAGQPSALAKSNLSYMEAEAALHLVCVKEDQHFICQPDSSPQSAHDSETNSESHSESGNANRVTATVTTQFLTADQQEFISNVLIGVAYLLPIGLGLGIFMYDRYTRYRATLLQHHVETLERIWQQNQNLQH